MQTPLNPRPDRYDALVVGAGPVGLALARLLAMQGVTVGVVDPNRVVCQHPRATHLDDETMRTLQTLGAADMESRFLRQSGWVLTGPDQIPFLSLTQPDVESDQGWYTDYQFHSPDFESRLRGLLATSENAALWFGWEAIAIEDAGEGVRVTLRERRSGREQELRAGWVVGTDGAGSFVRQVMSATVEDLEGTQTSLIIDVHPFEHPETLPRTTGFVRCDADMPVTYVPIFPPLLRFEFMLDPAGDVHQAERPDAVYGLLEPWLAPDSYRVMRADAYEWHAALAHGWRAGRMLLAGDAAHEMPPMLGQGMCSGLRDALNLAWKLARVIHGRSPAGLLDSYESERAAHVRPFIVESARQANMIEAFGRGERPPVQNGPQAVERFRPPLGPGLIAEPTGSVGTLSPQPRGAAGERLDDLTGYDFVVLGAPELLSAVTAITRTEWERLGVVAVPGGGTAVEQWLDHHHARAAVVRPDRYVHAFAANARQLDSATEDLVQQVLQVGVAA